MALAVINSYTRTNMIGKKRNKQIVSRKACTDDVKQKPHQRGLERKENPDLDLQRRDADRDNNHCLRS